MLRKIVFMKIVQLLVWLGGIGLYAQQRPHYAQYLQNNFLLNPAIAGIESYGDARFGYRQQWVGVEDAPQTFYLTAHLPIGNEEFDIQPMSPRFSQRRKNYRNLMPDAHAGAGLTVVQDQAGPWRQFSVGVSGAYHYPINDFWQVSAGMQIGFTQHTFDYDHIKLANAADPVMQGKLKVLRPDLHAGVWVYSANFFAGFAVQQIINTKLASTLSRLVPHYFLTAGYRLSITDEWDFTPSVMIKKGTRTPITGDLNLKVSYLENIWFGASYRQRDAFVGWIGTKFAQKFTVNYSYEYPISSLRFQTTGSHEITLGLLLSSKDYYASPRGFW